ncbi:MAG: class I SAM-dependent methyltransferase [Crocinitomicaceae bacterium]|nr:class I SAM-dependent methyltransferase [Crocinitomicaceae bacterium]MDB4606466.1 class I SAM-dependent methyltransferase [Crocinitomicaceae bacterium]MDG1351248.1 class I SAM-dependent methyltransferase [Crocinitomicaceae bacterium]
MAVNNQINTNEWLSLNRKSWDERTNSHVNSDFYNLSDFKKKIDSLNCIELDLLGNIENESLLHLQCHFGMDSLSLEKKGAKVTALDFSPNAIEFANALKKELGMDTHFVCADVYDTNKVVHSKFQTVFSSYGIVGWLPNLEKWANVISKQLLKGGRFILVDFHPTLWMFDDEFKSISYSYFNDEPYIEIENGSYADRKNKKETTSIWWSHSLSEIMNAFLKQNLKLVKFQEFNYAPYDCFKNTIEFEPNKFRIAHLDKKIPMVYAMVFES